MIYSMYSCFSFRRRKKNWVAAKKRDTYEIRYKLLIFVWKWNVNISTDKATHGTAEKRNINSSAHRASYHTNEKEKKRTSWRWVWMQEFFFWSNRTANILSAFWRKKRFYFEFKFLFQLSDCLSTVPSEQYFRHQMSVYCLKFIFLQWKSITLSFI